jgi:hypothetical protein
VEGWLCWLTLAAHDVGNALRAYVEPATVGEALTDMRLFLERGQTAAVPLEATYNTAFAEVPRRWRRVLEGPRVERQSSLCKSIAGAPPGGRDVAVAAS